MTIAQDSALAEAVNRSYSKRIDACILVCLFMLRNFICAVFLICALSSARADVSPIPVSEQDLKSIYKQLEAPPGIFPFVVALTKPASTAASGNRQTPEHFCTATMIAPSWAVTMAYCLRSLEPDRLGFIVLFGDTDLRKAAVATPKRVVFQDGERPGQLGSSIALIELDQNIPGSIRIAPFEVSPKFASTDEIGNASVVGWGQVGSFRIEPGDIHKQRSVTVRTIDNRDCNRPERYGGQVDKDEFCAQSAFEGIDVCAGFGGSPLVAPNILGQYAVLGLVNWGQGCARKDKPTVYTDLTHHVRWIMQVVGHPVQDSAPPASRRIDTLPRAAGVPRTIVGTAGPIGSVEYAGRLSTPVAPLVQGRIAGPRFNVAPLGKYRYLVSIGKSDLPPDEGHLCGGVLISPLWVLTAAHCVTAYLDKPEALKVRLAIDNDILSEPAVRLVPEQIVVHPKAHTTPFHNHKYDIALIKLPKIVPFNVKPPSLLTPDQEADLFKKIDAGYVVGYGLDDQSEFGRISVYVHQIRVGFITREQCNANSDTGYNNLVDDNELCAGGEGADSCQGDSGGPLLIWGDDKLGYMVAGLVSWGRECGGKRPGVYARVSAYQKWIEDTLK